MARLGWLLAMLLFLGTGAGLAQDKKDVKNAGKPDEVEVKFSDGSTVRVVMLQENIEVVTKFGKLLVPMSEVRKIDLGIHMENGTMEKIEAAMKKLNSQVFKERDEAVKQLIDLGPAAYPTLHAASKSKDLEVSKRVEMAIKGLKAKYPADSLRLTVHDRVVTHDFPIVGRITTPVIKAQNQIIGTLNLKLADLRSVLLVGSSSDFEVIVDATKYAHRTNWMDSGVSIEAGTGLSLTASGEVDLLPGNGGGEFISGPEGNFNVGGRQPGNQQPGQLFAKIGENGQAFFVGRQFTGTRSEEGKIYFRIVPGPWGNQPCQGSYKIKISTGLQVR